MAPTAMINTPPPIHQHRPWAFSASSFWTANPKTLSKDWLDFFHGTVDGAGYTTLFLISCLLYFPICYICALVVNNMRGKKPAEGESRLTYYMKHGGPLSALATWSVFMIIHLWQAIVLTSDEHQVFILVLIRAMAVAAIIHIGITVLVVVVYRIWRKFRPAAEQDEKGTDDIELQEPSDHVERFQRNNNRTSTYTVASVDTLPPYRTFEMSLPAPSYTAREKGHHLVSDDSE